MYEVLPKLIWTDACDSICNGTMYCTDLQYLYKYTM